MPLFKQWKEGGAQWGIWKVTESPAELQSLLTQASCLPEELACYKSPSRQLEYLAVRVLLLALTGSEHRIAHYPSGKPYLVNTSAFLSVSHTKGYVAVGLHPQREIGIDIEQVADRVKKVRARFVRPDELPGLENLSEEDQRYELLLVWSGKESLFKVMNTSEVDFLEHLQIDPFRLEPEGTLVGREYRTSSRRVYDVRYTIHPDFVCTYIIV